MRNEPALIVGAVTAVIALLVAFGAPVTNEQKEAIIAAVIALIPVILAIRQSVFAPATVEKIEKQAAISGKISPDLKPPAGNLRDA